MRTVAFSSLEGLTRGLDIPLDSPAMAEVLQRCGSPGRLPDAVPVERFREVLEWLAATRFPGSQMDEGLRNVGEALFSGYRRTILGQVQLAAIRLIGPDRLIARIPALFRSATNFGMRWVTKLGPGHYAIFFREVPLPGSYYCGMVCAALRAAGAANPQATFRETGVEDTDFDVRFEV